MFIESAAADVDALLPLLRHRRCQTIAYFGIPPEKLALLICKAGTRGGDRIVPIGHTLDFSLTWDGHDVIRALSRKIGLLDGL